MSTSEPTVDHPAQTKTLRRLPHRRRHLPRLRYPGPRPGPPHSHRRVGVTVGRGRRPAVEDISHLRFERDPGGVLSRADPGRRARRAACAGRPGRFLIDGGGAELLARWTDDDCASGSVLRFQDHGGDQESVRRGTARPARQARGKGHVHLVSRGARRVLGRRSRWYRSVRTSRCASGERWRTSWKTRNGSRDGNIRSRPNPRDRGCGA